MTRKTALLAAAAIAAGLATATLITPRANAWDIGALPAGFSLSVIVYPNGSVGPYACQQAYNVTAPDSASTMIGFGHNSFGDDCNTDFQSQLDAFVNAHYTPPSTTTDTTTTATTGATTPSTTAPTTTDAPTTTAPTTTSGAQTAAPATASSSTTTIVQTVTTSDATEQAEISALQQRLAVDEARITALENGTTTQILGEQKNMTPFTLSP